MIVLLVDLHTHCEYSLDSNAPLSAMLDAARRRGLGIYALTDHVELCHEWEEESLAVSLPRSFAAAEAAKAQAPCRLLAGIEFGQPHRKPEVSGEVLTRYRFDFVVGSLHTIAGYPDFFHIDYARLSDDELFAVLRRYYRELLDLVEWGGFDSLAHITYPYRYLNAARREREILIRPEMFDADADLVFEALEAHGKALELNTGSLARGEEDCALNARYLKRFRELGGTRVTVGSDAHEPSRVGDGLAGAYQILRDAGFRELTCYERREPFAVSMD